MPDEVSHPPERPTVTASDAELVVIAAVSKCTAVGWIAIPTMKLSVKPEVEDVAVVCSVVVPRPGKSSSVRDRERKKNRLNKDKIYTMECDEIIHELY